MGVFQVFKIVQMVPNLTKHHIFKGVKELQRRVLDCALVSHYYASHNIAHTKSHFLLEVLERGTSDSKKCLIYLELVNPFSANPQNSQTHSQFIGCC